jgi:hypothetical protein
MLIITVLPILGFQVTEQDLQEVTELSGVLDAPDDYITLSLYLEKLNNLLPNPENIKSTEFVQIYLMLKQRYQDSSEN